jgi:hypothetical protein
MMRQLELFLDFGLKDDERLYVIGNGFDIHHCNDYKYWDFKKWVQKNRKDSNLIGLMDTFFSNDREFWGEIEKALGEYDEEGVTNFCEPENPEDFKYDHPGQWQDGLEGSISWVFGQTMDEFRDTFNAWVKSIELDGVEADLIMPVDSKYLTFNYTETLEKVYGIPKDNVLHIHGSRLILGDEFVIGHCNDRNVDAPLRNEEILLPYQNAYSEVIRIMNEWKKDSEYLIKKNEAFFHSLRTTRAVCVMGLSYSEVDMPYLQKVADSVAVDCKWWLYYYNDDDRLRADKMAVMLGLNDYCLRQFE